MEKIEKKLKKDLIKNHFDKGLMATSKQLSIKYNISINHVRNTLKKLKDKRYIVKLKYKYYAKF